MSVPRALFFALLLACLPISAQDASLTAVSASGDLYTVMNLYSGSNEYVALRKSTPGGAILWNQSRNAFVEERAAAAVADPQNGVMVAAVQRVNGRRAMVLFHYTADGQYDWQQFYADTIDNVPTAAAADRDGEFFVAGNALKGSHYVARLWKYSPGGGLLWMKEYDIGTGNTYSRQLQIDLSGNVSLGVEAFQSQTATSGQYSLLTITYDQYGGQLFGAMKNALLLLALACGPAAAASTDTFVSVEADPVANLDPAAMYDVRSLNAALNIYEPLIVFGADTEKEPYRPFLAAEVPTKENGLLSADGRTYAFPIRPGVLFHDGTQLTAEDVRYSLLRFMLSDFDGGPSAMLLEPVFGVPSTRDRQGRFQVDYRKASAAVTAEGDKVVVRLQKPDASFLAVLASWPMVLSKSWAVSQGEWDGSEGSWRRFNGRLPEQSRLRFSANGTGPFRVAGAAPQVLTLERHDDFWRGPAALRFAVLRTVPSEMLRLSLLETGDADQAGLSRSSLRDASQLPGVKVTDDLPSWSIGQTIFFNFRAVALGNQCLFSGKLDGKGIPPDFFSDPDLRRAFAHAFNYEVFLKQALRGKGERACGPIPFERFSWKAPAPRFGYDRAKAVEHFKAAWKGRVWKKGFQAEIGYDAADPEALQVVDLLAAELKAISPRFTLLPKPLRRSSLVKAMRSHQLPVFVASFEADFPDPHSYAFNLMHSAGYFPQAQNFGRKSLDAWVEKARMARPQDREALYRNLQLLFDAELPQIHLYHPIAFRALRANVEEKGPSNSLGAFTVHNAIYYYRLRKQ